MSEEATLAQLRQSLGLLQVAFDARPPRRW